MFRRLDKFDGPIFGGDGGRGCVYTGGFILEMLIGFQIWGVYFPVGAYILGDVLTGFCDIWEILER